MLSDMAVKDPGSAPLEIEGFMFREYFLGRFSVWGDGAKFSIPGQIRASWRLPRVAIRLEATRLLAENINSKGEPSLLHQTMRESWSYREIERAQIFRSPRWARRAGLSTEMYPTGVRLHFGESRAALLVFTGRLDELLAQLERHAVKIERSPIKLSPMLFGRR